MLPCPLYQLTGLQCPYCGTQRAIVALFQGAWLEAWMLNPVFWMTTPYLLIWVGASLSPDRVGKWSISRWAMKGSTLLAYLAIMLVWGIVRNVWTIY